MFNPKNNQNRKNYSDLLKPPDGYWLDKAVGTTYSLDLEALASISICLGLSQDTDSKIMLKPINMLNVIQKVNNKILIFCEAGQIKMPSKSSSLSIFLENMIIPIALSKDKHLGRYPAFHPKTWILCYTNSNKDKKYRFVIMSRNLTFDRSWDICFAMDSTTKISQKRKTEPIINFLDYLSENINNNCQNAARKMNMLSSLKSELANISFSLDSDEFGENFQIMPMGIGEKSYNMNDDALFCKNKNSADYKFNELVIMSPFITGSIINEFNKKERGLNDCCRTLITRRSELNKLSSEQTDNFNIYTLKDDIIDGEDYISDQDIDKSKQDIHAKIYLIRRYSDVNIYIGSMNSSYAAINKNVEMMIKLSTKSRYLNGISFLNDIFCGAKEDENNPFEKVNILVNVKDDVLDEHSILEQKIKDLCRVPKKACISKQADNKYSVKIKMTGIGEDESIKLSPFNSNQQKNLDSVIIFEDLDILQLSEFYEVIASLKDTSLHRVIIIHTLGLPKERENAVVNSIIKDRFSFVEYISLILGDNYLISFLEGKNLSESGFFKQSSDAIPALYENMLKTALEAPERMKDIEYILKMISNKEIVPDEFRTTYEMFCKILKLNTEI